MLPVTSNSRIDKWKVDRNSLILSMNSKTCLIIIKDCVEQEKEEIEDRDTEQEHFLCFCPKFLH